MIKKKHLLQLVFAFSQVVIDPKIVSLPDILTSQGDQIPESNSLKFNTKLTNFSDF